MSFLFRLSSLFLFSLFLFFPSLLSLFSISLFSISLYLARPPAYSCLISTYYPFTPVSFFSFLAGRVPIWFHISKLSQVYTDSLSSFFFDYYTHLLFSSPVPHPSSLFHTPSAPEPPSVNLFYFPYCLIVSTVSLPLTPLPPHTFFVVFSLLSKLLFFFVFTVFTVLVFFLFFTDLLSTVLHFSSPFCPLLCH